MSGAVRSTVSFVSKAVDCTTYLSMNDHGIRTGKFTFKFYFPSLLLEVSLLDLILQEVFFSFVSTLSYPQLFVPLMDMPCELVPLEEPDQHMHPDELDSIANKRKLVF